MRQLIRARRATSPTAIPGCRSSSSTACCTERGLVGRERGRGGRLRRPAHPARRVPRAAALGPRAADRGHAERRPGRAERQAHLKGASGMKPCAGRTRCSARCGVLGRARSLRLRTLLRPCLALEHRALPTKRHTGMRPELARSRGGYIGAAGGAGARRRRESCWRTTGTRPGASSSTGSRQRGARVETADIRRPRAPRAAARPSGPRKVFLLAAQASRPLAEREPRLHRGDERDRRAPRGRGGRGAGVPLVYGSSLHVYGAGLDGRGRARISPTERRATSRTCPRSTRSCACAIYARRAGFELSLLRLGIVYGPSPVEHDAPESQTVVDKFRRLAAAGEELPLDDGGRATIGVVHVEDAARILLESPRSPLEVENVAAETRHRRGRRRACARRGARRPSPPGRSRRRSSTGTGSRSTCLRLLVTGAAGFLGSRIGDAPARARARVVALGGRAGASAVLDLDAVELRRRRPGHARLIEGCAAVLHFAGVPDPASARADPARAVRENAGTTLNLLEGCRRARRRARLSLDGPGRASSRRPTSTRSRSASARTSAASIRRRATVVRFTSVFGPGPGRARGRDRGDRVVRRHRRSPASRS